MPRGKKVAATAENNGAPKKRGGRRRRRGPVAGFAPFLLLSGGPRKKPRAISTFLAAKGRVAALVRKGVAPDDVGLYQRRKVKVEQVVKI